MGHQKQIISRRYYPTYYGRTNTYRSYRSYYVGGTVRPGSADRIVGTCDASVADGWILGKRQNPIRSANDLYLLPGFGAINQ